MTNEPSCFCILMRNELGFDSKFDYNTPEYYCKMPRVLSGLEIGLEPRLIQGGLELERH